MLSTRSVAGVLNSQVQNCWQLWWSKSFSRWGNATRLCPFLSTSEMREELARVNPLGRQRALMA